MTNGYANAREAQAGALQIRKQIGASFDQPLAIVDAALEMGILVHIMKIKSMEGMWCKEKRLILLTSLRPPGRKAFTCAHEMAHFHFSHGTHIDELLKMGASADDSPDELLANQMAGYLLMPPFAVPSAIQTRRWSPDNLTPAQAYRLASFFGVSYTGLLNHMYYALRIVGQPVFDRLSATKANAIRGRLCPGIDVSRLVVVDQHWKERPVDLEVGNALLLPPSARHDCSFLESVDCSEAEGAVFLARAPGLGKLKLSPDSQELLVRVMPDEFHGFAENRFPEKNNVYHTS